MNSLTKSEVTTWKTKNGREIPFEKMEQEHLEAAHRSVCERELIHHNKLNFLFDLRSALEDEAVRRGFSLLYPDQVRKKPRHGKYFSDFRKVKLIKAETNK